jgi:hypothetical protein
VTRFALWDNASIAVIKRGARPMSWDGVHFKLDEAEFFLGQMIEAVRPIDDRGTAYLAAAGALVGNLWQPQFYYHVDAFLAAIRSVPDIIQAWFGLDMQAQRNHPDEP